MKLKKLTAKNFLSFQEFSLSFDNSFVIEGINIDEGGSNGSGKSAIIEAIIWGLYGENLRGVNQEQLLRYGSNSMSVSLHFDDFTLTRTYNKEGSNAYIVYNSKRITGVKNVNKFIEEKFGKFQDFMLFSCFTDKYRFSKLTETERKKLVERFVDLKRVDELLEKVKEKENEIKRELDNFSVKIKMIGSFIEQQKKELLNVNEKLKLIEEEKIEEIDLNEYNKLQSLKQEKKNLELELLKYKKELEKIKQTEQALKKKVCPLCQRPLEEEKLKEIEQEHLKLVNEITKQSENINNSLEVISKEIERLKHLDKIDIKEYLRKLELKGQKKQLVEYKKVLEDTIQRKTEELKNYLKEEEKWKNLYEVADFWKKQLGYKGVKNILLKSFFSSFEEVINYYLEFFGFPFQVEFLYDEEERFKVYLVNRFGRRELDTFSQGEKRKFDIAVIFAIRELLRGKQNSIGWLFFDEVFDGLDISSIQRVLEVFDTLEENFVVVSHISVPFPFKKVKVEKVNGISKVIVETASDLQIDTNSFIIKNLKQKEEEL
jgi:DNA repair exonuclease SbcCD ATPase subunit